MIRFVISIPVSYTHLEKADDVHVSGDINLVLDDKGGESNVAKGTVKLSEGTYSFKVYNLSLIHI